MTGCFLYETGRLGVAAFILCHLQLDYVEVGKGSKRGETESPQQRGSEPLVAKLSAGKETDDDVELYKTPIKMDLTTKNFRRHPVSLCW